MGNNKRIVIGGVVGGMIGLGVGYVGQCTPASCPLTSNPIVSVLVGALIGAIFMMRKKGGE